ncbi:unnamed protein product [Pylaiella littoralis]
MVLNHAGASMLDGKICLTKYDRGNSVQGTRVPPTSRSPANALVAAMMRPDPPKSMNVNDFHHSLGHANSKALVATAKQLGIKLTGIQEYCAGCAEGKATKRSVPTVVSPSHRWPRAMGRLFKDMRGPNAQSAALYTYDVAVVDDGATTGGSSPSGTRALKPVVRAIWAWYASSKPLLAMHAELRCLLTDNGSE